MKFQLKRSRFALASLIVAFLLSLINLSCDFLGLGSNSGLEEDFFGRVDGTIHIKGTPPDETDELLLALITGTSPRFTTTISRRDLNLQASEQDIDFIIEAQADTFDALFAIWKKRGRPLSVIEDIVGSYCEEGSLIPIQMANNDTIINIDTFDVNLEKVNRVAGVSGVIQFNKDKWPGDIDNLALVFADPALLSGGLNICNLLKDTELRLLPKETPVDSLTFDHNIAPGPTLIIVAWNKKGESLFDPANIKIINETIVFVQAIADSTIEGIDITAKF